jgi:hypothetical protein
MKHKKFSGAASAALTIVIMLTVATGAWGQSKYKTLHKFTNGKDGDTPLAA